MKKYTQRLKWTGLAGWLLLLLLTACSQPAPDMPLPVGPLPSQQQVDWHRLEYYAFVHFNMNTFTDQEWGYGDEDAGSFNPEALDCRQWVRIFKKAGMNGVILTAKHHDGFCLWPSEYTEHSVKNAPWKNGKGDVLQELAEACREYDMKMGLYLSPWDRNHAEYGRPAYLDYFRNQLKEILTQYGAVFEVWFDGANGGDGYYGGAREVRKIDRESYYQWAQINQLVLSLQPNAIIFSDNGPGARWIGNEQGIAGETNWNLLNPADIVIGGTGGMRDKIKLLNEGDEHGSSWIPGEADVSVRPGWYYHPAQDTSVKSLEELLDIYYKSIGRGANLLLNIPVDNRGLVHENDSIALMKLKRALDQTFSNNLAENAQVRESNFRGRNTHYKANKTVDGNPDSYWATDDSVLQARLTMEWEEEKTFNRFLIQEYIPLGQRVKSFQLEIEKDGAWIAIAEAKTIGNKRILRFPAVTSKKLRLVILDAKACPLITEIGVYAVEF